MLEPSLTVIKVGGSLLEWPELPLRLTRFLDSRRSQLPLERLILIVGGGSAADLVRRLDTTHGVGDQAAHDLALHALDLTALLLAAILPRCRAVDQVEALSPAWEEGVVPILAPRRILAALDRTCLDPLPATWDVTSDSIAAWIALSCRAECLILLKSATLPADASLETAARLGRVDPMLPRIARALPRVEYVNLRHPGAQPWDFQS